ncbi:MAG: serine hydrolase [Chloroflexi bacterium]|nr:serine hydrolase [Chloroflexota bacterium]
MDLIQPEKVGLSSVRLQRMNLVMQQYVDQQAYSGIVTLVARKGQIAHLGIFGWQEKETNIPMAVDTIFPIHSMTKPVTSAAVMMLCEEAKLHLSDPVSGYIPEFKDAKVMVARGGSDYDLVPARREMTIHDLLTHTAGLSYDFHDNSILDEMYGNTFEHMRKEVEPILEKRITAFAQAKLPLAFHPGTDFRYSFSIDVLGYIVQKVSGQFFADFLQERIFQPLGMADTDFWVPPEKAHRLAAVYGPAEQGGIKVIEPAANSSYLKPTKNPSGGGGLVSTSIDFFRFGQMLLNGGQLNGVRLLGRHTVAWMLQNHLPDGIHPVDVDYVCNGFGLGGSVLLNPGLSHRPGSVGKFGWSGSASTSWWIDPVEEMQGVLMLQYEPAFVIPINESFSQLVYQALE